MDAWPLIEEIDLKLVDFPPCPTPQSFANALIQYIRSHKCLKRIYIDEDMIYGDEDGSDDEDQDQFPALPIFTAIREVCSREPHFSHLRYSLINLVITNAHEGVCCSLLCYAVDVANSEDYVRHQPAILRFAEWLTEQPELSHLRLVTRSHGNAMVTALMAGFLRLAFKMFDCIPKEKLKSGDFLGDEKRPSDLGEEGRLSFHELVNSASLTHAEEVAIKLLQLPWPISDVDVCALCEGMDEHPNDAESLYSILSS
jgi:hypothetical protein